MKTEKTRRLHRSITNRWIAGVFGGFGEMLGIDPVIFRILFIVLTIWPGHIILGIILYAVAVALIPSDTIQSMMHHKERKTAGRKTLHDVQENDVSDAQNRGN